MTTRQLEASDALLAQMLVKRFHDREVSSRYMAKFLSCPTNFLLVAEIEGQIVGFLSAHELDSLEREAAAMFIYEIEVAQSRRRQGVGAALIEHIGRIAQERAMFEMFVFTNHSNSEAVAFYYATGGEIEEGDELMFVWTFPIAERANTEPE